MYKILVVTHGELARGLKETLKMFTGEVEDVYTVSLTEAGVEDFKLKVQEEIDSIYEEGQEVLVLADLFGGTPFNVAMLEIKNKYENVEIIAGVNLPLLIEANLLRTSALKDIVKSLEESAKEAIMNPDLGNASEDDE